ncbi:ROK family protein [Salinisphaera hydrothermalis]|uniref:ROK family protein n=1 Tax=Salinisphaera hydrothermalis TaxID=563188 RepID=UPI0033403FB4
MSASNLRLGIDLGCSRMIGAIIDGDHRVHAERHLDVPIGDYPATVAAIAAMVSTLEQDVGIEGLPVGVATPGRLNASKHLMCGSHVSWLNARPLPRDLAATLGRDVRTAHKAGCLARAEYLDGAAEGATRVFAAVLGTGVSGALLIDGQLLGGSNGFAGTWSHNSLPWPTPAESRTAPTCGCGQHGCIEAWLSGPGMSADHVRRGGHALTVPDIVTRAEAGERLAGITLRDWLARSARSFAAVINLMDPQVIVVGGGLSRIRWLYSEVPKIWGRHCVADELRTTLVPAAHGDASIARGAALLWPLPQL